MTLEEQAALQEKLLNKDAARYTDFGEFVEVYAELICAAQEFVRTVHGGERSVVSLRDLGGALGAAGGLLPERDTLRLGGTFEILRPGLAQFRVAEVRVGALPVPLSVVPAILSRSGARRSAGVAEGAIGIPIPRYIADVRVARGRITLYKTTP